MINCKHCNTKINENDASCPKCGAPNAYTVPYLVTKTEPGRCPCGMLINDVVRFYEIKHIICGHCGQLFEGAFYARYHSDRLYPNGQLTHLFSTSEVQCPHCGQIMSAHEFYHGISESEDKNGELLTERFKKAYKR